MSKFSVITFSILFFGGAFSIVSLVFYFGDWQRLLLVTSMGVFIGLVAAPSIEPKAFKYAWRYEIVFGSLAGLMIALIFENNTDVIVSGMFVGGLLGYLAPYWVKYVQLT